ncbi:TonB-dependent receptor domain-containing protein [Thiomicrorhabdus indica]|uniref:TonB-dependent receptor domain-containing protein n=1 Tax=Thiomicrorhabdus indica TaxID=2267253 RepID=UPI002AA8B7F2|nr:TonB-dependent receptor [Thiomicrorhabdus indica]
MFTRKRLSLAILSALVTAPTMAQAVELPTVDVEAPAPASQVSTTETSELVANGNSETGTALRNISGVEGSRLGGHGVDLFIRGQGQSQLNILLDGAKIEGGCPNRMDPPTAYAEINSYDEIIVTKGVATVTKGSGGTGGTVEFVRETPTYDPNKMVSGSVSAATSTNGINHDLTAKVQAVGEKGYVVVQGNTKSADNYEDGNGNEVRSSYESRQGHIDLGWTPNKHHEVKLSYENTVVDDALFQGAGMDAPESDGTTLRLQYKGNDLRGATGFIDDVEIDVYQSEVDHIMDNYTLRPSGDMKMVNQTNVTTDGAKLKLTSMIGHTQLDYGVQTEKLEKISTLKNAMGASAWFMWPETQSTTNSVFAESTSFFKDNQKVILGLRYDMFDAQADGVNKATDMGNIASNVYQSVYGVTDTDNDSNDLNVLARYEKQLNANTEMFAGVSRTFRYPNATELYIVKGTDWVGNPNLNPEEHNQIDLGLSQSFNSLNWSANAFYDKVDNYILSYKQGGLRYGNIDAKIYGLELAASAQVSPSVIVGFDSTITKGSNEDTNTDLANMSPFSGKVFAQYQTTDLTAGARMNFAQKQDDVNTNIGEKPTAGWSTVDLYGSYQINKTIAILAGVDNVFDKAYQNSFNRIDSQNGNLYNLYEPGRIIWARVNANF